MAIAAFDVMSLIFRIMIRIEGFGSTPLILEEREIAVD